MEGIVQQFFIQGSVSRIEQIGSGHINSTYRIFNSDKNSPDYLLQKINTFVFPNADDLTENLIKVTTHLCKKIDKAEILRRVLTPIPAKNGKYYYQSPEKECWRMLVYISDSKIHESTNDIHIAFEAGKAFGNFLSQLSDFPSEQIVEVLPRFHDPIRRINEFIDAVTNNKAQRVSQVKSEILFIEERIEEMKHFSRLEAQGLIPKRIAHYDTKCSNILFDENDKALCVIDLDTLMPGFVMLDFGDSIRTFANVAAEDEIDLSKIKLNIPIYKSYTKGFITGTKNFLTNIEKDNLAFGAKYITYEQAIRFLTDYLNGDVYYHVKHKEHNLQRARAQLQLLIEMENHYDEMKKIVDLCN